VIRARSFLQRASRRPEGVWSNLALSRLSGFDSQIVRDRLSDECVEGGFLAYSAGEVELARAWFLLAIRLKLTRLGNWGIISILSESLLGSRLMGTWRRLRQARPHPS
jgi:hypothetical protein